MVHLEAENMHSCKLQFTVKTKVWLSHQNWYETQCYTKHTNSWYDKSYLGHAARVSVIAICTVLATVLFMSCRGKVESSGSEKGGGTQGRNLNLKKEVAWIENKVTLIALPALVMPLLTTCAAILVNHIIMN
jgi:hypothetical protein